MPIMDQVLQAEDAAAKLKEDANIKSNLILDEAKTKARLRNEEISQDTSNKINLLEKDTLLKIDNIIKDIEEENQEECAKLRNIASKNQDEAIDVILRRIAL